MNEEYVKNQLIRHGNDLTCYSLKEYQNEFANILRQYSNEYKLFKNIYGKDLNNKELEIYRDETRNFIKKFEQYIINKNIDVFSNEEISLINHVESYFIEKLKKDENERANRQKGSKEDVESSESDLPF